MGSGRERLGRRPGSVSLALRLEGSLGPGELGASWSGLRAILSLVEQRARVGMVPLGSDCVEQGSSH